MVGAPAGELSVVVDHDDGLLARGEGSGSERPYWRLENCQGVGSPGDEESVGGQRHRMVVACGDGNDIGEPGRRGGDGHALDVETTPRHDLTISLEGQMKHIARGHCHHVGQAERRLRAAVPGEHRSVGPQGDGSEQGGVQCHDVRGVDREGHGVVGTPTERGSFRGGGCAGFDEPHKERHGSGT